MGIGRRVSGCAMKLKREAGATERYVSNRLYRFCIETGFTYLVIRSNMDLGSRMKVGSTTRLKSAPGRN